MGINLEILALVFGSAIVCGLAAMAAVVGISVLAGWSPTDSGRRQLAKERRALLVETAAKVVLVTQLASLVVFVAVADRIHPLFPGAMCAVGTLNAHSLGYPTLLIKVAVFLLCALWLILNRATPGAATRGLVRFKYGSLVLVAGALVAENLLQFRFFSGLRPDIITSCCATVFGQSGRGVGSELAALPSREVGAGLFLVLALTIGAGLRLVHRGRFPAAFSILSLALGGISVAAVISWIAPSVYELPTHHCPLCLLASPHRLTGYLLYGSLAVGLIAGCCTGAVHLLRRLDTASVIPDGQERQLCTASMAGFILFTIVGIWPTLTSAFRLGAS